MTNTLRILSNLSSAFFTASGMWGDLLLIRIFLTCAYAFIIAIQFTRDHNEYEMYVWAFACIYLHGSSAIRLIIDEGTVKLDENQEQVCTFSSYSSLFNYLINNILYSYIVLFCNII